MLKTNEKHLVKFAVQGQVMYTKSYGWEVGHTGIPAHLPSVGGITYNVKVGDPIFGLVGDHIEPGVTFTACRQDLSKNPNLSFNAFSCVGNTATLISGAAKGKKGIVTGHHGGVEHVIVDFDRKALEKMTEDDKILITCFGVGLRLTDFPEIHLFSLAPGLLNKMKLTTKRGILRVPVAAKVPARLMGSGLGTGTVFKGDYDIQTSDKEAITSNGLDTLRFGDFVAIFDHDARYGYSYKRGAITIGIVIHGDSMLAGHGPGVQVLMSSVEGNIEPVIDTKANIADILKIGSKRR